MKKHIDGLTKYQRYRLKDLEGYRKRKREWAKTDAQKKKRNAYMRLWKEKNKERVLELAKKSYHKRKNNPEFKLAARNAHLKRHYNITVDDYEKMFANQNGRCAICSTDKPARNRFHVDHDHLTGKVRQLLCSRCNTHLGWFEKYQKQIINYLK